MDTTEHYGESADQYGSEYNYRRSSDSPERRNRGKRSDRRRNSRDYSSSRSRSRSNSRSATPPRRDRPRNSPDRWRHDMYRRSEDRPNLEPNNNLIVKGLPLFMEESQLWKILKDQGFAPRDVRILKHKDTGQSRGFGFVEFCNVSEATSWMEHTKGRLKVDDRHYVDIQYTTARVPSGGGPGGHGGRMVGDWICSGCNMNNFKKRDNCFKCGITREESERNSQAIDGFNEIGVVPCDTILLRDLPQSVTEDKIISALRQVTTLEIIRLILAKHSQTQLSRGYAYVQMRNVQEATQLLTTLTALTKLTIDGKDALVSYAKMSLTTLISGTSMGTEPVFNPSDISNSAAAVAQNAIRKAQAAKQLQQVQLAQQLAQQQGQLAQAGFMLPTANVQQLQQLMAAQALQEQLAVAQVQAHVQAQMQAQNTAAILNALQRNPGLSLISPGQLATLNALQASGGVPAQPGLALNPLMAASLAGSSGLNVGVPDKLGTVITPQGEFPKFPPPDTSKFQLEESSGYYYDPTTNFYYDPKSQYYFNSVTQKWVYWDPNYQTYLPADDNKVGDTDRDDKGGKKEKVDKVKVAKKIQKDMEKWAKTLNQKKEHKPTAASTAVDTSHSATSEPVSMSLNSGTSGKSSGTADAGYFILEGRMKSSSHSVFQNADGSDDEEQPNPSSPPHLPEKKAPDDLADLVDWQKLACLLCKRAFNNKETLVKHQQFSDLHKKNLEEHMKAKALEREIERQSSESQYRDRAKERREKFGLDNRVHPDRLKQKYMESRSSTTFEQPTAAGIGSDNIGSKLLKSMGWNEGQGLGRANQGIVDPINAERRIAGAGLGTAGAVVDTNPSANYQESLRAAMRQRYMAHNN